MPNNAPAPESGGPALEPEGPAGCSALALGLPLRTWDTLAILLLAVAADVCLYTHPGGTGAGVLLITASLGLLSAARSRRQDANPLLMTALLLAALAMAWNSGYGEETGYLRHLVGWVALLAFAIKLHRPDWHVTEVIWAAPWTLALAPLRALGHLLHCLGYAVQGKTGRVVKKQRLPLRVVVAPVVVTVLFVLIFIAANPVVERMARDFSERLGEWLKDLAELFEPPRPFTWVLWLLAFAALVRPAATSWIADLLAKRREDLKPPADRAPDRGNYAAALSTLLSVNVLFLAFNAMDSVYLYFKAALPRGITYSDYSHRGCFWLTMGLALSTAVIGVVFRHRLNFHPRRRALDLLSCVWALQNGVLAVGALRRLQMYIGYNGLTRLRIVGIYGVLLVVAGLALMVWKVRRAKNVIWLVRRDTVAFWVALVLLALTPRDYICATYNTAQILSGNLRPLVLIHGQPHSPESYPPLIPLLDYTHPSQEGRAETEALVRKGVAGFLGRALLRLRASRPESWTDWEGSYAWALGRLEAVRDRLDTTRPGWEYGPDEDALRRHARQWW